MPEWGHEFPLGVPGQPPSDMQRDREIRRLRIWLQDIAVANGLRANKIIGIIDPDNLPSSTAGKLVTYVSFGDEPDGADGIGDGSFVAGCHACDLIIQT